ncbi:homoserine O-acetyltransferase [Amycolatopsis sp. WAC 04169]|uniref:homoserine O-acetyltransferase MetX n=1 Tax=Amycolatopsis sp. WAC 04169 TaxID=2203197 RepID=UPI00351AB0E2
MLKTAVSPPPATGAWREGDPPGRRRWFTHAGAFALEGGGTLPEFTLAFETWGRLNPSKTNAVLLEHAFTGDSHAAGEAGPGHPSPGWWDSLIGPGLPLDTDRYFIVAANALGGCQGSTGPASLAPDGTPWGSRFPLLTLRDLVAAEARLSTWLGISRWRAVIGGSMGGNRALEWAATWPERVAAIMVLGSAAVTPPDHLALGSAQIHAITAGPGWHGGDYHHLPPGEGPHRGLGTARRIAHLAYRAEAELEQRFGRRPQDGEDPFLGGRFAIESYFDHHADKLVRRFDAGSYVTLTRVRNSHDLGRGRGGVSAALAGITAEAIVARLSGDRMYRPSALDELATGIPGCAGISEIVSPHGHDGFLTAIDQIGPLLRSLLD